METETLKRKVLYVFYVILVCGLSKAAVLRSIKKICKLPQGSDIDLLSERGVRIEPVSRSHVQLDLASSMLSSRSNYSVHFEFKTSQPNGVLFYSRPQKRSKQSIALVLHNGHLKYKIKCPTLHADIFLSTRNMKSLNDSKWHQVSYSVKFKKHGRKGHITVDGIPTTKRYEVSCDYMSSIIIGGTGSRGRGYFRDFESSKSHFDGCIRNVRLPNVLQTPPKYYAVSNCD